MSVNPNQLHEWRKFQEQETIRGDWKVIQDSIKSGRGDPLLYDQGYQSEKRAILALRDHMQMRGRRSWWARIRGDRRLVAELHRDDRLARAEMNDDYNHARGIITFYRDRLWQREHIGWYRFERFINEAFWPPAAIRVFRQERDFLQRFKQPGSDAVVRLPADEWRGYLSTTEVRALVNGIMQYYAVRAFAIGLSSVCFVGLVLISVVRRLL